MNHIGNVSKNMISFFKNELQLLTNQTGSHQKKVTHGKMDLDGWQILLGSVSAVDVGGNHCHQAAVDVVVGVESGGVVVWEYIHLCPLQRQLVSVSPACCENA